jgi:CubicO group peptidase (beta-lactamase class C family)
VRRASLREMQQIHTPRPASIGRDASGDIQLSSGGYGFGLGIAGNCDFAHIVSHTGGLPGFGSIMLWLPEYGVGIMAFGNRTYTGWRGPTMRALQLMQETGALQPREPQPSPALVTRRDEVTRLVLDWDDALADRLAAVNLFLDRSSDRRRAEIATLLRAVGPCRAGAGWDEVENALRQSWTLPCERGELKVAITLAPTTPPTVQYLQVTRGVRRDSPVGRGQCEP